MRRGWWLPALFLLLATGCNGTAGRDIAADHVGRAACEDDHVRFQVMGASIGNTAGYAVPATLWLGVENKGSENVTIWSVFIDGRGFPSGGGRLILVTNSTSDRLYPHQVVPPGQRTLQLHVAEGSQHPLRAGEGWDTLELDYTVGESGFQWGSLCNVAGDGLPDSGWAVS